ncbi:hypothetical protein RND81_03G183200 [Saponaria officinalis]|uniref:CRAL-TRIO domain-containing protein n=2 Tax=Saponaria officinalis TaxID=3572 RepID=A0AAW1M536_SAPOF
MNTELKNTMESHEKSVTQEQQQKIDEVRSTVGPIPETLRRYCSDASIARYLQNQNWNVQKATKMLKESLKWRSEYKPDEIRWEDVAHEAETGKIYRSTSVDKKGRPVLVMRPCRQNSSNVAGQMKYLVYCIENAMLNLPAGEEEMIWVVDFWNFKISNISMKVTKELAHILQNYYPQRLGVALLYNPPWIFEQFYKMVKPFLETRTRDKVKFVYSNDSSTMKIMEDLFDMEQFESVLGEKAAESFDINVYAQRMKEDDEKRRSLNNKGNDVSTLSG